MDNNKIIKFKFSKFTGMAIFLASILILLSGPVLSAQDTGQDTSLNTRQIMDYSGRTINIPAIVDRIICSGPGALRLVTYLNAQNLVVGVDDIEKRTRLFDARPYAFANPHFKKLPVFGGFRGHDSPEKILGLDPLPQVILKTFATMGYDPAKLEKKTDIPVITLEYGDLLHNRKQFYASLTILGQVLARENPEVLFLDLSTLQMGDEQGGWHELKNDPVYMGLSAVTNGKVYGLLPYNWYTQNFGSILANAWFIGKNLYPDRFLDIVPEQKADEIYSFLVAAPVFTQMNNSFRRMAFQAVDLK